MAFPWQALSKRTVHGVEAHWITGKKEGLGEVVSKKDHINSLQVDEKTY